MNRKFLYYVTFAETSEAEGRVFLANKDYPVYEKDKNYVILCAENGDFCFSKELMEKAIKVWDLKIKNVGRMKMDYFELVDPYYALIKASTKEEAVREYIATVAGEEGDFETLLDEAKLVPEYYAAARLGRAPGEDGKLMDLDEVISMLKNDETQLLLIDGSLI